MQNNVNLKKIQEKWTPVLTKMGITDPVKQAWMSEAAEYHAIHESAANGQGFATMGGLQGMGAVTSPIAASVPGYTGYSGVSAAGYSFGNGGQTGSGDYGQQLFPIAMKVAAQTIGLDLVAVKPSAGPVIDLMYVDFRYDDAPTNQSDINPQFFKIGHSNASAISGLISEIKAVLAANKVRETSGGLNKQVFFNLGTNAKRVTAGGVTDITADAPATKTSVVEFLGFSRVDGLPMFKSFRTTNVANFGSWSFSAANNSFAETETISEAFATAAGSAGDYLKNDLIVSLGTAGTVTVDLISTMEDHLPGFVTSTGKGLKSPMTRDQEEDFYAGVIGPQVHTKRVQIGSITVKAAVKRTEIEDIKSQTGIDIIQKLEAVLVNELSQTISKQIVNQIFDLGNLNRASTPNYDATKDDTAHAYFDFNVDQYFGVGTAGLGGGVATAPGGETTQSAQRRLWTKVRGFSNFIATEGRVGPATFLVTNAVLAAVLTADVSSYALAPVDGSANAQGQLYPCGKIGGLTVYVDPYMKVTDKRIALGRKNNPDQPGLIFVPYLMAQSIQMLSEGLQGAPISYLRSRYAISQIGFFPQKQYGVIYVTDTYNILG